jgi:hypothetical protein
MGTRIACRFIITSHYTNRAIFCNKLIIKLLSLILIKWACSILNRILCVNGQNQGFIPAKTSAWWCCCLRSTNNRRRASDGWMRQEEVDNNVEVFLRLEG